MDDEAASASTAHDLEPQGGAEASKDLHTAELCGEDGIRAAQDTRMEDGLRASEPDLPCDSESEALVEREVSTDEPGEPEQALFQPAESAAAITEEMESGNQPHDAVGDTATEDDARERSTAEYQHEESVSPPEVAMMHAVVASEEGAVEGDASAEVGDSTGPVIHLQPAEATLAVFSTEAAQKESQDTPNTPTKSPSTLFVLCLRSIGRHIKSFYNMRLYPPSAPLLSKPFEQALYPFDLSTLYLLEDQRCFERIAAMKRAQQKHKRTKFRSPDKSFRRESVPLYALGTSPNGKPPTQLASMLGLDGTPELQLRVPNNSDPKASRFRERRSKWKADTENQQPDGENTSADEPVSRKQRKPEHRDLKLSRQPLTNIGCGYVAEMLQAQPSLVDISLQNCQITCAGAIILANALKGSKTLRRLDLSNNDSKSFRGHAFDNNIRDIGATTLAVALERNRSLVYLSLSCNHVGTLGGAAIGKMLQKNTSLRRLELGKTSVEDAALDLIQAFERSTTLEVLNLQWCALRPGLGSQLAKIQAAKSSRLPIQRS